MRGHAFNSAQWPLLCTFYPFAWMISADQALGAWTVTYFAAWRSQPIILVTSHVIINTLARVGLPPHPDAFASSTNTFEAAAKFHGQTFHDGENSTWKQNGCSCGATSYPTSAFPSAKIQAPSSATISASCTHDLDTIWYSLVDNQPVHRWRPRHSEQKPR